MKSATAVASLICKKTSKPSGSSAAALPKLFKKKSLDPISKSVRKRPFDPSSDCVVADQRSKKKASNTRMKPKNINVVLCGKMPQLVPKGRSRRELQNNERIVKLQFRRSMTVSQVRSTITSGFSKFDVEMYQYLRCGQDNNYYYVS